MKKEVTSDDAKAVAKKLGIDWQKAEFALEDFRFGMEVEYEHGSRDPETDVTHDDPLLTGKIAWAHLKEFPDYYKRLKVMEAEADDYWTAQRAQS